jgi:dihydrofolate reductase
MGDVMANVLWHITMSLDGFIAGPDDAMDWAFDYPAEPNPVVDEVVQATGAILAGRRWYDAAMRKYNGRAGIYGGAWTGPVLVLTHKPPAVLEDPEITFVSDGIEDAVATALAAANGKGIVVFGADIARQSIAAGLLDEILIHLAPVLLGDGVRLYGRPGAEHVKLERTAVEPVGQLTNLRFRVVK